MPSTLTSRIRELETENERLRRVLARLRRSEAVKLKQVRQTLVERERDLRTILDNMPSLIAYWDRNQRNRFGNQAYLSWFGVDPADMPGKHLREVIGEDRYRLNLPYIEGALGGEPQTFERAISMPDGSGVRHSLANYLPDIVDGDVRGFFVLVTDITAIREAKEALRISEARYHAVLEDQTELISRLLEDGTYTFVNGAYCRFFGKTEAEIIGHKWTPVCYPDDLVQVQEKLGTLTPENPVVVIENRVYSSHGDVRWVQFVNRGFFDATGRLLEIQAVGRDITVRKRIEAALHEAHEELEQRVIERTEDLRRLAVEATLAEERERHAIAEDLHDDLGQILHVAKIKLDSLAKQMPTALAGYLQELNVLLSDASRQVRSLTSQLSPPVLKRLGMEPALRWLAEEMGRQYDLQVSFESGRIQSSPTPVQSAILFRSARELLINAAKHSGSHSARLGLAQNEHGLVLTVADSGIGIADLGSKLSETRGFGLASLRERLEFLGGKVDIVSPPEGGLYVTLSLPIESVNQTSDGITK